MYYKRFHTFKILGENLLHYDKYYIGLITIQLHDKFENF